MAQHAKSKITPWHDEAHVTASALRAAGIPAVVANEHIMQQYPNLEFGFSRPKVLIPPACRDDAREILAEVRERPVELAYACSDCGGRTRRVRRIAVMILFWLVAFQFFPFFRRARRCPACRKTEALAPPAPFTAAELGYEPETSWDEFWQGILKLRAQLRVRLAGG